MYVLNEYYSNIDNLSFIPQPTICIHNEAGFSPSGIITSIKNAIIKIFNTIIKFFKDIYAKISKSDTSSSSETGPKVTVKNNKVTIPGIDLEVLRKLSNKEYTELNTKYNRQWTTNYDIIEEMYSRLQDIILVFDAIEDKLIDLRGDSEDNSNPHNEYYSDDIMKTAYGKLYNLMTSCGISGLDPNNLADNLESKIITTCKSANMTAGNIGKPEIEECIRGLESIANGTCNKTSIRNMIKKIEQTKTRIEREINNYCLDESVAQSALSAITTTGTIAIVMLNALTRIDDAYKKQAIEMCKKVYDQATYYKSE